MAKVVQSGVSRTLWFAGTGEFGMGNILILAPGQISPRELAYCRDLHSSERLAFAGHIGDGGSIDSWEKLSE